MLYKILEIILKKALSLFVFFLLFTYDVHAQSLIQLDDNNQEILLAGNYSFCIGSSNNNITENNIIKQQFTLAQEKIPIYNVNVNNVWLKFQISNKTNSNDIFLDIRYSNLSKITLYKLENNKLKLVNIQGNTIHNNYNSLLGPNFIFPLKQYQNNMQEYLLHVESNHPIIIPAYACTKATLLKSNLIQFIIAALFTGILLAMIIYNTFLFFAVHDNSYIIYVIYTISLLLAQLTANGYMSRYVWIDFTDFNLYSVILTSNFTIVCGVMFAINFLQIKRFAPLTRWLFSLVIIIALIDTLLCFFNHFHVSYDILNYNSLLTGIVIFFTSIYIAGKGYKPAYLYLIAWTSMLIALILLALRNINILPYNNFTSHIVYIGAAIETTMLSFALADKINIYKKEKEESQAQALKVSKENEKLIQEQNVSLEKQVAQRTHDLEKTLRDLKDAQVQLVESEKMASLGQLTAGIAHEINNPINFVKSNVSPLLMDVKDLFELITEYQKLHGAGDGQLPASLQQIRSLENRLDPDFLKEEIENLIGGIEEGAERTAEIVRGLRNFSRLDESEMKEVNIYDNINSTLILLRNATPYYLKIRKHFEARGDIECYPGKLNQVFMNILTNCIHAVKAKAEKNEEEYIDIVVTEAEEYMRIEISDTGVGMTDEVKHKIFDPFFTTKDVGEGTGLGMSIVFKIIEKHHGKISVHSIPGEGAAFTIEIPYMLKTVSELAAEETAMADEELETE